MQTSPLILRALALVLSTAAAQAGGIALFEGPAGGVGNLRLYDELNGAPLVAPPELQGIRLLPIDFAGRTPLEELLPGRPRRRSDVAGASRLALAGQRGSLYHFSRALAGGGASFGYFRIAADGGVSVLLEQSGAGPLGTQDPFLARVALAPGCDALLAATTISAGGNLYEIDLGSGTVVDRTSALPPLRFHGAGLSLQGSVGIGATTTGILRFDRGQPGDAGFVSFAPAPAPAWFSGQVVASRNGQWFLTSAGSDAANQLAFAFGTSGNALAASSQPAAISGAGFEPEASDGPFMAIRDDGQQAAWRIEAGTTREIMLAHVQPAPGEQPQMLSSSANFLDTVDEIGLAIFRPSGELHVAIGQSPGGLGNALEAFDTYLVTLPAAPGPASFVNLSLFSGDAQAPFDVVPLVKTEDWRLLPDFSTLLVQDGLPSDGVLYAIRPGVARTPVLGFVKRLDALETSGRWLVASYRRSDGNRPQELWRMPLSLAQPAALLLSLPDGTEYTRFAARRDGWLAFVSLEPAGTETLQRAHLQSGALQAWNTSSADLGAALGFTQYGSIAFSLDNPAGAATWPLGTQPPVTLQSGAGPCQVLPGL